MRRGTRRQPLLAKPASQLSSANAAGADRRPSSFLSRRTPRSVVVSES